MSCASQPFLLSGYAISNPGPPWNQQIAGRDGSSFFSAAITSRANTVIRSDLSGSLQSSGTSTLCAVTTMRSIAVRSRCVLPIMLLVDPSEIRAPVSRGDQARARIPLELALHDLQPEQRKI